MILRSLDPTRLVSALCVWALLAAATLIGPAAQAQARFGFDATPGPLPKDVVPSEYRLALALDPDRDTFTGVVDIAVDVRRPVDAIALNAWQLTAGAIELTDARGTRPLRASADPSLRQWRMADGQPIEPGSYRLRIDYAGVVHPYGQGLFGVGYTEGGRPARMLATQMEPIDARSVFPGFDEPAFRARFAISVTAPAGFEVVSNMPVVSRAVEGETTRWDFAPTPPMPSYLVTVAVGHFDALEDSVDGIPLRILTAPGKREQARYAMEVTKQILPFYRAYFGIPYALPKLDQLATPGVRSGAMEDWGAISYIEDALLFDPARSSTDTRRGVFTTVAHEIAHQWFGDLVTAASWDEIWLNEAFATWLEQKATAHFNPAWQTPLVQVLERQRVMRRDAGPATRSIRAGPVLETATVDVFDGITYVKGAALLAMLETWLGPEAFRRGLQAYVEGQQFSNATAGDLWFYLAQASGRNAASVARSWTDQPGFPLLDARATCEAGELTLALEQHPFGERGAAGSERLWQVPFEAAAGSDAPLRFLLTGRQGSFVLGPCEVGRPQPWSVDSSTGFFRVRYPAKHRHELALGFAALPAPLRLTLLTGTLALAQSESLPLAAYLELVAGLHRIDDAGAPILFKQAAEALAGLDGTLAGTPAQADLRRFARGLLRPVLARLGWGASSADSPLALGLRNELIGALGRFGDESTLRRSNALFAAARAGGPAIDPAVLPAVIGNVARRADADVFDALVRRLETAEGVEDRLLYAAALGQVENPVLARRFLDLSLGESLPPDSAAALPSLLSGNSPHAALAYAFTRDHFELLARKAGEDGRAALLPRAAASFSDARAAAVLLSDQQRLVGATGDKRARETADDIELRSRIRRANRATLPAALARIAAANR